MLLLRRRALAQHMPWFLVDDHYHSDPRVLKLLVTEPEALNLWAVAGSWSSAHLTDGVVQDEVLPQLFPDSVRLAEALVTARLWKRVKGAHKFIQDGLCKIPSRQAVERDRTGAAERKRRQRAKDADVTADVTPMSRSMSRPDSPVDDKRKQQDARSGGTLSRRDIGVTPGVTLDQSSPFDIGADVVNPVEGPNARARATADVIEEIIKTIYERTSRVVGADWAEKVAGNILAGQNASNPAAYCRVAILNEADPVRRFLPAY